MKFTRMNQRCCPIHPCYYTIGWADREHKRRVCLEDGCKWFSWRA